MNRGVSAIEPHTRREWIGDRREHVEDPAPLVRPGEGLERRGARREREVEGPLHDLACDRAGLGHVALGIEAADRHGAAVHEALLRQAVQHAADGVVEEGAAHLLEHADRRKRAPRRSAVGREQEERCSHEKACERQPATDGHERRHRGNRWNEDQT
jgi:hypothetical protein